MRSLFLIGCFLFLINLQAFAGASAPPLPIEASAINIKPAGTAVDLPGPLAAEVLEYLPIDEAEKISESSVFRQIDTGRATRWRAAVFEYYNLIKRIRVESCRLVNDDRLRAFESAAPEFEYHPRVLTWRRLNSLFRVFSGYQGYVISESRRMDLEKSPMRRELEGKLDESSARHRHLVPQLERANRFRDCGVSHSNECVWMGVTPPAAGVAGYGVGLCVSCCAFKEAVCCACNGGGSFICSSCCCTNQCCCVTGCIGGGIGAGVGCVATLIGFFAYCIPTTDNCIEKMTLRHETASCQAQVAEFSRRLRSPEFRRQELERHPFWNFEKGELYRQDLLELRRLRNPVIDEVLDYFAL